MKPVLDWVKGNVVTVVLLVVMVGALVALPLVSRKLNASVRADVESRLKELQKLEALDKTTFEIGPISQKTLINPSLLDRYRKVTGDERGDASQVVQLADRHNRKDRTVLLENVLPTMEPPSMRDVLPSEFHDALIAAYDDLLATVRAGEPPSPDDMAEEIKRKRIQFMSGHLQREEGDDLNDEETVALRDHLTDARYKAYVAVAEEIGFYLSKSDLDLPTKNRVAPLTDLFEWQWQYWITEDILLALADANAGGSVLGEPVKRVLDLYIWPDSAAAAPAGRPGGRAGGGGGGPGWGGGGGGGGGAAPAPAAGPGGMNYSVSMTGRTSNDLYDVRRVRLSVIVENDRIPVVFDALARRNFITVLDVTMNPVDIYAAAADGFLYGRKPVSELVLDLETVWLRSWTSEFMPDAVKQARGIRDPAAPPAG